MAQELPEGTVTVLFTDVEGSTDLTTRRGDEAAQEILRAQRELVRQQVERHSGHEVKSLGDGFMVAFASARRAVACAVGIQRALDEHNRRQPPDQQVRVRIGLNTGEVIQEEADLFGEAVNAAARIAAKVKGGQILVSEVVRGVLGRPKDVELVDRGRFRLKGFPERWRLFEVVWQEEAATIRALALVSELVYGVRASVRDPARFSFAHGGKDGHPYPVDRRTYDRSIEALRAAVERAKLGRWEKLEALRRLAAV